ncbi:2,5-dichloro-2,5-cyclohexadiene-1,4-diol dehydrogenase [Xylaria sp. FL0043]|nr:2,5-dichloro-2,5-cyclohexadiene-1,4-diol dehydrogenase [Xylaria sp. FL0043]
MARRFEGKTAVVTGAASGMGREVAELLAAEGAQVIALDLSFPETETASSSSPPSPSPSSITRRKHDVSSAPQWNALATTLRTDYPGGIDILVNAAGVIDNAPLHEVDLATWQRTLDVDLGGVMLSMRALIPLMKNSRPGGGASIINFSSVAATISWSGFPAYHAAKAAVTHLTRNAAVTYAVDGIRVNAVHPGIIASPMVESRPEELRARVVSRTPMGRMGTSREVAACVLFLASDDVAFVTGSAMVVDGGLSIYVDVA